MILRIARARQEMYSQRIDSQLSRTPGIIPLFSLTLFFNKIEVANANLEDVLTKLCKLFVEASRNYSE